MGRNYLTGRDGDRINAVLAAAGYNFSLLLRWFEELFLSVLSLILWRALLATPLHLTRCCKTFFTADELENSQDPTRTLGNGKCPSRERAIIRGNGSSRTTEAIKPP
jgi:hypothetical protein